MKKLKLVTLRFTSDLFYKVYKEFFNVVERYEVIQILRYDNENIWMIFKVRFIDTHATPKILEKLNLEFYDLSVIAEDKSKGEYVCFSRHHWPKKVIKILFKNIESFLIELPILFEDSSISVKFLIEDNTLDKFLKLVEEKENMFEIVSITSKNPNYDQLYLNLTERQKEIIFYAVQHGYYDIPRKIDSRELADRFNVSKSVLWEHIRKIERYVFKSIFG